MIPVVLEITSYLSYIEGKMAADILREFFASGAKRRFSPGEIILHGEENSGVFYIADGFVTIYSISDEGNRYIHAIYKTGEVFPLIRVLMGIRRRIFYEAASNATMLEVPPEKFTDALKNRADLSYAVLEQLAEQFVLYADRLDNLQYKAAYERIIYRLLFLASRFGVRDGDKVVINAPITHEVIAASINLARETVSREIENLEKKKLVSREKSQIVLKDITKLAAEFSEPVSLDLWGLKPVSQPNGRPS